MKVGDMAQFMVERVLRKDEARVSITRISILHVCWLQRVSLFAACESR